MARAKIINNIRQYLVDENIYTPKDEITLQLLEITYSQFTQAVKDVKKNGQIMTIKDSRGNIKDIINPSFRNQLELQKQLFKLIDSLYLSPKSRKTRKEEAKDSDNPFEEMMKDLTTEKR